MDYKSEYVGERSPLPTHLWGEVTVELASFTPAVDGDLVVEFGAVNPEEELLLRIHSECVFSEALSSSLCDCGEQLHMAMRMLKDHGSGMLIYLRFDGRGAGLAAKLKATSLEVAGADTYESRREIGVEPEGRNFEPIGLYLRARGFQNICLMTNNPEKILGLRNAGLAVRTVELVVANPNESVKNLYKTKQSRFGHSIRRECYE